MQLGAATHSFFLLELYGSKDSAFAASQIPDGELDFVTALTSSLFLTPEAAER